MSGLLVSILALWMGLAGASLILARHHLLTPPGHHSSLAAEFTARGVALVAVSFAAWAFSRLASLALAPPEGGTVFLAVWAAGVLPLALPPLRWPGTGLRLTSYRLVLSSFALTALSATALSLYLLMRLLMSHPELAR